MPQQNGVVERKHRHLLDTALVLLFHAGLPSRFWGECVLTAAYLKNRMPIASVLNRTPYKLLLGNKPTYSHLRSLDYLVYSKDNCQGLRKFSERERAGGFVGYPATQQGYRIYDLADKVIYTSRGVTFMEGIFPFRALPSFKGHNSQSTSLLHGSARRQLDDCLDFHVLNQLHYEEPDDISPKSQGANPSTPVEVSHADTLLPSH
ncbi:unnamed protein product [Linum trigynum]|uniref:Integrase catalytic domain-containing protein n=1 Tax=Linum trigynum TaxID=586398 RepID=A0AAV2E3T5_9ROSI